MRVITIYSSYRVTEMWKTEMLKTMAGIIVKVTQQYSTHFNHFTTQLQMYISI